jgi:malate dehydrogenase
LGVQVKLGVNGVEEVIQIEMTGAEKAALEKSAASVRELLDVMGMSSGA